VTVIPVARVRWGFGGGSGSGRDGTGEGSGGGGGVIASPVGYLEVKDGRAKFRAVPDLAGIARLVLVNALAASMILCGLGKLLRAGRERREHGHHRW
jgi:uncharacterized spore protein YtfJ